MSSAVRNQYSIQTEEENDIYVISNSVCNSFLSNSRNFFYIKKHTNTLIDEDVRKEWNGDCWEKTEH